MPREAVPQSFWSHFGAVGESIFAQNHVSFGLVFRVFLLDAFFMDLYGFGDRF